MAALVCCGPDGANGCQSAAAKSLHHRDVCQCRRRCSWCSMPLAAQPTAPIGVALLSTAAKHAKTSTRHAHSSQTQPILLLFKKTMLQKPRWHGLLSLLSLRIYSAECHSLQPEYGPRNTMAVGSRPVGGLTAWEDYDKET